MEATVVDRTSIKSAVAQLDHLARHLEASGYTYSNTEVMVLVSLVHSISNMVVCMDALNEHQAT